MIVFRHADPRFHFLWESSDQPAGRWHGDGEGPAHYFADTPHGAWAELLRHEEIRDVEDLAGIRRALWAVDVPRLPTARPRLDDTVLSGGPESYVACRAEAARRRARGLRGLRTRSAALSPGQASGWQVDAGLTPGPSRDGETIVLFGRRPDLVGWPVVLEGPPPDELISRVRHFENAGVGRESTVRQPVP
ncbi:MAG: RES domain-containing protein [Thermoanaerobaculia bacterium]